MSLSTLLRNVLVAIIVLYFLIVATLEYLTDISSLDVGNALKQISHASVHNQSRNSNSNSLSSAVMMGKMKHSTTINFLPFNASIQHARRGSSLGYTCNKIPFTAGPKYIFPRLPLPDSLVTDLMSFTTKVTTTVNLLILGDSVAMQLYDIFSATGTLHEIVLESYPAYPISEHNTRLSLAVSLQQGGGVVAAWRMTDFLLQEKEGLPGPNADYRSPDQEGGWTRDRVQLLLNATFGGLRLPIGSYDTLLFRIPVFWQPLERVTKARLVESLQLAHELTGITTVILMTMAYSTLLNKPEKRVLLEKANSLLRQFAASYVPEDIPGITRVVLLDVDRLTSNLISKNMKLLGINASDEFVEFCPGEGPKYWPDQVAFKCGRITNHTACGCDVNSLTFDGIHFCTDQMAGRLLAGTACLLKCLHEEPSLSCHHCNDKFMTLQRIS